MKTKHTHSFTHTHRHTVRRGWVPRDGCDYLSSGNCYCFLNWTNVHFQTSKIRNWAGYAVFIFSVRTGLLNQWFADHMRAIQLHVVPNFHQLIVVAVKASFCPPSYFNTCARSTTDKSPSNVRQSPAESFSRSAGIRPQAASFLCYRHQT